MLKRNLETRWIEHLKAVGRGRSIMAGGQVDGLRGNNHKADLRHREGVATTGALVHRGQTHRPNARGIRAKPLTNTTAGEKNPISTKQSPFFLTLFRFPHFKNKFFSIPEFQIKSWFLLLLFSWFHFLDKNIFACVISLFFANSPTLKITLRSHRLFYSRIFL